MLQMAREIDPISYLNISVIRRQKKGRSWSSSAVAIVNMSKLMRFFFSSSAVALLSSAGASLYSLGKVPILGLRRITS